MPNTTADTIRNFEGFIPGARYDRNAWRVGYGSDTWMDDQGNVHAVQPGTTVTRQQAEADLARRIPEFQQRGIIQYVGQAAWDALPEGTKSAVTSLAYNYGSLAELPSLVRAIQSGDNAQVVQAIQNRAGDNSGINRDRRMAEANLAAGHPVPGADVPGQTAVMTELDTQRPVQPMTPNANITSQRQGQLLDAARGAGGSGKGPWTPAAPTPLLPTAAAKPAPVAVQPVAPALRDASQLTANDARAEQNAGRKPAPAKPTPIIPALGKTVQQIGQEADNARLSGYRDVQEGYSNKNAKPNTSTGQPTDWSQVPVVGGGTPTPMLPSGSIKANTVNVRPDGTSKPVQQAGTTQMGGTPILPGNVAGGVTKPNSSGSPDDRQKVVTYEVANPAYAAWLKQYGNGGANVSGSPDDRDERKKVPAAPSKTITKTRAASAGHGQVGSPTPVLPETFKGASTGKDYVVGSTVKGSGGRLLTANKDGSFTDQKTGRVSVGSSKGGGNDGKPSADQKGQAAMRSAGILDEFGMIR